MRTKTTKTVTEQRTTTKITCDFCGKDLNDDGRGWARNEASVEALVGDVFPEGDFRKRYRFDSCSECFVEKLIPAIESATGAKHTETDADDY